MNIKNVQYGPGNGFSTFIDDGEFADGECDSQGCSVKLQCLRYLSAGRECFLFGPQVFKALFIPANQPTPAAVDCIPGFTNAAHYNEKGNKCFDFNEIAEIIEDPSYTSDTFVTMWTHGGVVLLQIINLQEKS